MKSYFDIIDGIGRPLLTFISSFFTDIKFGNTHNPNFHTEMRQGMGSNGTASVFF